MRIVRVYELSEIGYVWLSMKLSQPIPGGSDQRYGMRRFRRGGDCEVDRFKLAEIDQGLAVVFGDATRGEHHDGMRSGIPKRRNYSKY